MANVPAKSQEERARERKEQRRSQIFRVLKEIDDKELVLVQLKKNLRQLLDEEGKDV